VLRASAVAPFAVSLHGIRNMPLEKISHNFTLSGTNLDRTSICSVL
jgi:hypothetical protein